MDYETRNNRKIDDSTHPWESYDDSSVNNYSLDDEGDYEPDELSVSTFTLTED